MSCNHTIYPYDQNITIDTSLGVRVIACPCGVGLRPLGAVRYCATHHRQPGETLEESAERCAAQQVAERLPRDWDYARREYYSIPCPARRGEIAAALRAACTARDLLSTPGGLRRAWDLVEGGKKYTAALDEVCTRRVQAEARTLLLARRDRRAARAISEAARSPSEPATAGMRRRIVEAAAAASAAKKARAKARLMAGKLGLAALEEMLPKLLEQVSGEATAAVRAVVAGVGRVGDQAAADLQKMGTAENFAGKKSRHHKLTRTTICRVERLSDWSGALITLRDYASFGSSSWGSGRSGYGSRGGSAFRAFLVVRDSTTGEAHVIRIPPKFGNAETKFFRSFRSGRERIQAAVAWTFSRAVGDYSPTHQA